MPSARLRGGGRVVKTLAITLVVWAAVSVPVGLAVGAYLRRRQF